MDLDVRLDRSRLHVRAQRAQLGDCLRRSQAVRLAADEHRRHALARVDAALAGTQSSAARQDCRGAS